MKVHCRFDFNTQDEYTCFVTSLHIFKPQTVISEFVGIHKITKTNNDVRMLSVCNQVVEYFPHGIPQLFPKLDDLQLTGCGLKEITREDLIGFNHLEILDLSENELKTLPNNLLINKPKLRYVFFDVNKIEKLNSKVLKPIANNDLEEVNFKGNPIINEVFKNNYTIENLMEAIDLKSSTCQQPKMPLMESIDHNCQQRKMPKPRPNVLNSLFASGDFSDFTFVSSSGQRFEVHKCVIAPQSKQLREIFEKDRQNEQTNQLLITGYSDEAIREFVGYFYTGEVAPQYYIEMEKFANTFEIPQLKSL